MVERISEFKPSLSAQLGSSDAYRRPDESYIIRINSIFATRLATDENALSIIRYKALSSLIETEPWGFESDEKFINAAVLYQLHLPKGYNPEAEGLMILEICKDIERRLGRTGGPVYDEAGERVYSSRPIDIDILLFGDNRIDCEELTVPHRLMWERDFVMTPLKEIAPQSVLDEMTN